MPNVHVGVGVSAEADTLAATHSAVREALAQAGLTQAAWAICFFTAAHLSRADAVRRVILDQTGCHALCGCSAVGVLGADLEIERKPGLAVMVGSSPALEAHSRILPQDGQGLELFQDLARRQPGQPALMVLPDAFQVDNQRLRDLLHEAVPGIPVLGAGSTDDGSVGISLQLGMEGVRSGSIAMLGLYGRYELAVGITQSCTAVGEPHFITQAKDHVLVELDGRPALQTFIEQGQALGIESMQEAVAQLMFGFPLDAQHPQFTGESCLVRSLAGFDQATRGLVIPHQMQQQGTMGFMHRNARNAEQDMQRMVAQAQARLSGPPDFGVYFDCAARGQGLYGRPGVDVGLIRKQLGPIPLIGMFGGFELATAAGAPQIYTYTGALALLRVAA